MTKKTKSSAMIAHSAGGIVLDPQGRVIVVNQNSNSWSLPKGHIDAGENALQAARREIHEECGLKNMKYLGYLHSYKRPRIGLKRVNDTSQIKHITLFLFTSSFQRLNPLDPANPCAKWVSLDGVSKRLTHPKDGQAYEHCVSVIRNKYSPYLGQCCRIKSSKGSMCVVFVENKVLSIFPHRRCPHKNHLSYEALNRTQKLIIGKLKKYLEGGSGHPKIPCQMYGLPKLQTAVLSSASKIPYGKTISYKKLASMAGRPKALRVCATLLGRNPILLAIPCHRVISSSGALGGFSAGLLLKKKLLEMENQRLYGR